MGGIDGVEDKKLKQVRSVPRPGKQPNYHTTTITTLN